MYTVASYISEYNYSIYCKFCDVDIHRAWFNNHCETKTHLVNKYIIENNLDFSDALKLREYFKIKSPNFPKSDDTKYCEFCNVLIHRASYKRHCETKTHKNNML